MDIDYVDDIDLFWIDFRIKLEEMIISEKNSSSNETMKDLKEEIGGLKKEVTRLKAVIDAYKELMN